MPIARKITEERDSNIFSKIAFLYKPYWPLFVILVIFFLGMAYLYKKSVTPIYETTARVLIKDEKKGVEEAKTVESLDGFSGKKIIENEIEVIKSPSLIDEVVAELHLYAPIYQKKSFKQISAYITSPVKIEVDDINNIRKISEIEFAYDSQKKEVVIGKDRFPINEFVATPFGKLRFYSNPNYKGGVESKNFFFNLIPAKSVANSIDKGLKVSSANKLSSIINLSYQDEVPERAEDILNVLLRSYNASAINEKNTLTANTLNFIDERLKLVKRDLDDIEGKIQQYKSKKDAIDISTQGRLFLENVSSNDQKLGDINMQLAVLNQVNKYVTSKNSSAGIVPSTLGVSDPTLSNLVNNLYNYELEYESIKKTAGENNPILVSLKDQIDKIRPSVVENIQGQMRSLEASKKNLSSTTSSVYSSLQAMPEKERQLIDINREQGIKNQIYNFLLQKREETALSHASTVSNNKVVDKARTSDNPVSPKGKVIYFSSFLMALLCGVGIVLSKEKLGGKIMFIHDIEELTSQPIIGEITAERSKDPIVIGEGKRTLIAEQFRKIRTALNYLGISSDKKKILVTSSISGEGKSFVAVNLALSLAITGKKVILLDFDLNNPSLNNKLGIEKQKGVAEFLVGACAPEEIIQPSERNENLFLIATGELPINPSELIMNGKIQQLFEYLDARYDYLVIDTAPVEPVIDAYLLSPFCDATLYIVRHNYTPKSFVERIDIKNKIHSLKNIAIIFNGVTARGFGSKSYGYGYQSTAYSYGDKKRPKLLSI